MDPLSSVLNIGNTIIDKLFTDKNEVEKAKTQLIKLNQSGELNQIEAELSIIKLEAKSKDKFVSRARPAFLYVMYALLLSSIPMGFLSAYDPIMAKNVSLGMREWLGAFPPQFWTLFGVGYIGYATNREYGKSKLLDALSKIRSNTNGH